MNSHSIMALPIRRPLPASVFERYRQRALQAITVDTIEWTSGARE